MDKLMLHVLIVLMLCSLVLVFPATAVVNGKIAFTSNRDGYDQIYVMNADGTGQTRLYSLSEDNQPAWSPDGKKIAFVSRRNGYQQIYIMNADGTGQTQLTFTQNDYDASPAWSPDGKKIAFERGGSIYVMNAADGTGQARVSNNPYWEHHPAWSPDGKYIAFSSSLAHHENIFTINVNTGQISQITNDPLYVSMPSWSPDGKYIAYQADHDLPNRAIYVINVNTHVVTDLTKNQYNDWEPAWSPDGKYIAFLRNDDIYVMNAADGSRQTRLTTAASSVYNQLPAWDPVSIAVISPNGGEIWKRGTSQPITWSYTGNPGSTVKIVLSKGSLVGTIASNVPIGTNGKGSYIWPIASSGYTGSDYEVSVQSTSQPTIKDTSDNYFTITSATTAPSITVMSPNGGEKWYKYTTHTITWTYTGNPGSAVKIVIIKGSTVVDTFNNVPIGSSGKGTYSWWIKTSYVSGSDYKVLVQSTSQPTIKDTSNTNFGISWP